MADDDLADFEQQTFSHGGKARTIFRLGSGPAVIVIAEIPGITPKVATFARLVASIGCTAVMPHLFGEPGKDPLGEGTLKGLLHGIRTMAPLCVSREFTMWATNRTSPVVDWLRALAAAEHERCGGPGVGAIGMCFTGGYALAMATHPSLLAPVLSQPSMPVTATKKQRHSIDCSPADLDIVKARCATEGLQVLGLRFKNDRLVSGARFEFLREQLGDAFVAVELEDDAANTEPVMKPHSVLTEHLIDEPGEPTRIALDQVLDLFRDRLLVESNT
jgi:dienelactone hydrolase